MDIIECRPSQSVRGTIEVVDAVAEESSDAIPSHDNAIDEPLVALKEAPPSSSGAWFGGGKKLTKMFKSPVSMVRI